jgi:hypothetical protein
VLLKIVYLLTCPVLGVVVLVFRGDRAKAARPAGTRIAFVAVDLDPADSAGARPGASRA